MDNDILETFWGQPVSHVAQVLPAADFIRAEAIILESTLPRLPRPSVLSLSGSNPLQEEAFAQAREGNITVFLDTPHEEIVSRMGGMLTQRIAGLKGGEQGLRDSSSKGTRSTQGAATSASPRNRGRTPFPSRTFSTT